MQMTNEEAIERIKWHMKIHQLSEKRSVKITEALQMAIEALSAEPAESTDLISRQALCEYALNQKDKSVTPNDIMRFPSADRPTGKWIKIPEFCGDDVSGFIDNHFICSECKKEAEINPWGFYILSDFCPNCGAKMEATK